MNYGFAFRALLFVALAPLVAFMWNYILGLFVIFAASIISDTKIKKKLENASDKMIEFPAFLLSDDMSNAGKFIAYWIWGVFCMLTFMPLYMWLKGEL